jgi:hypothetical protein
MAFEIATGEQRWSAAKHPLLGFFRHTQHPDIDIAARARLVAPKPKSAQRQNTASVASACFALA